MTNALPAEVLQISPLANRCSMADLLSLAWQRYLRNLRENPLKTKSATSGVLSGLSNIIAQRISSNGPLNWRRALAMAGFGYFITAPATHYWHKILERLFPRSKNGKEDDLAPYKKVLLDVLTFGPIVNLVALLYISRVVDGRSMEATKRKVRQDYPSVVYNSWKFWPLIHFVNFRYVSPQLRVPFVSTAALFWSVFLILKARRAVKLT